MVMAELLPTGSFKIAGRYGTALLDPCLLYLKYCGNRVTERTFSFQLFRPRSFLPGPDEQFSCRFCLINSPGPRWPLAMCVHQ